MGTPANSLSSMNFINSLVTNTRVKKIVLYEGGTIRCSMYIEDLNVAYRFYFIRMLLDLLSLTAKSTASFIIQIS